MVKTKAEEYLGLKREIEKIGDELEVLNEELERLNNQIDKKFDRTIKLAKEYFKLKSSMGAEEDFDLI